MFTRIFGTTTEEIKEAAEIIKDGGLVAFPTETVYGLGADALNPEAVGKVYAAKGRPSDNPMIVHISSKDDVTKLTAKITEDMQKLMDAFWPGPMTMVCPALDIIPRVTTGGLATVGIRFPSDPVATALISESGTPIAAPSANLSGKPSPTSPRHVADDLEGRIDAIIAGEECKAGIESTVVDMTGETPMILRPGVITAEDMSAVLGKKVGIDPALLEKPNITGDGLLQTEPSFKPKAPGMKYKHYAPKAEMIIYQGEPEAVRQAMAEEKLKLNSFGQKVETIIFDDEHPEEAAHDFFARLRACDKQGVDVILASALREDGIGFAVMNRMFKSAGYNIKNV